VILSDTRLRMMDTNRRCYLGKKEAALLHGVYFTDPGCWIAIRLLADHV
jgi:hypothetical protein